MDLARLVVRCLFVFMFLLVFLRAAGKRTLKHGSAADFVFALILGDLVDDAVWREVPLSEFVVAATTLLGMRLMALRAQMTRRCGPEQTSVGAKSL